MDYCKGCFVVDYCNYPEYNKNGVCPCTNCLIKMVCNDDDIELCDEWKHPTEEVQKFKDMYDICKQAKKMKGE